MTQAETVAAASSSTTSAVLGFFLDHPILSVVFVVVLLLVAYDIYKRRKVLMPRIYTFLDFIFINNFPTPINANCTLLCILQYAGLNLPPQKSGLVPFIGAGISFASGPLQYATKVYKEVLLIIFYLLLVSQ